MRSINFGRKKVLLYFTWFYIVWTVKEVLFGQLSDHVLAMIIIKFVVWIMPVYLILRIIDHHNDPIAYLRLKQNMCQGILVGIMISILLSAVEGTIIYVVQGHINFALGWRWLTTFLFAFPEEVVFRGFLLQKLAAFNKFTKANLYISFLFASIHFPVWFVQGTTIPKFVISSIMVFIVGYGLGLLFKKTDSLWSTTIVHSVYNLLQYLKTP